LHRLAYAYEPPMQDIITEIEEIAAEPTAAVPKEAEEMKKTVLFEPTE